MNDDHSFIAFLEQNWPRQLRAVDVESTDGAPSRPSTDGNPAAIGQFQVRRRLGSGGFATVYLACYSQSDREVALKVPHPETARSEDLRRRFEREARAAASLDHPNINPIYETSDPGAAALFIASHYCAGPTLADWLKRRLAPVAPSSAARLVATLARAVQHAHERGILHRDLKPSNVLLEPIGQSKMAEPNTAAFEGFVPRLCDFGLARIVQEAEDNRTRTGTLVGTPRYMAPEQAIGESAKIGPASDVYALGVILYELLVGRPPFVGDTELETLRQVRSDEPISIRRLQPKVPRDMDTIAFKCLEKEPQRRYESAGALADDLERFIGDLPIVASPRSLARRTRLWTRRHPVQAIVLMTGMLVALGLPAGLAWHNVRLERAFRIADEERIRAQTFEAQSRKNEQAALANAANVGQHVYASDMRLANQLIKEGEYRAAAPLIDRHDPDKAGGKDRRGFEWWHLRPYRDFERRTWRAHTGELNTLAFSRDGSVMMTASYADRCAKTWEVESGRQLAEFPIRSWTEPRDRKAGAISPDGELIATIVDDHHIVIGNAATGEVQARIKAKGPLFCVDFSTDGQMLVAGGMAATNVWRVGQWDASTWEGAGTRLAVFAPDGGSLAAMWQPRFSTDLEIYDLNGGTSPRISARTWYPIQDITYSPDGRLLGAVSDGPRGTLIYLFNADTGDAIHNVNWNEAKLRSIGFSADGKLFASVTEVGGLQFWESASGRPIGSFRGAGKRISQFAFSPDDRILATANDDGAVSFWDRTLLTGIEAIRVSSACSAPVVYSPTAERVAVSHLDHSVVLVDAKTARVEVRLEGHRDRVTGIAYSPDGRRLASVDGRHLRCWSADDGRELWHTLAPAARDVAWSPIEPVLATGGNDGITRLWSAVDGRQQSVFEKQEHAIVSVRFFPDGKRLASCTAMRLVHIWDLATQSRETLTHDSLFCSAAISNDGRLLAALGPMGKALLFRVAIGQPSEFWEPQVDWYSGSAPWYAGVNSSVTFSPDGTVLGRAGAGGIFRADDLASREPLYALSGRGIAPVSVAFSPDGRTVAAVSSANELTFWDTTTWRGRRVFGAPLAAVRGLSFSANGKDLAVATDNSPHVEEPGYADFPGAPNLRVPVARQVGQPARSPGTDVDLVPWQETSGSLRIFAMDSGTEQDGFESAATLAMLPTVAWSHSRQVLAAASRDGGLWVWDTRDRAIAKHRFLDDRTRRHIEAAATNSPPLVRQSVLAGAIRPRLAFSPDGSRLASIDTFGDVKLWDTERWEPILTLPDEHIEVHCLAFSPDGAILFCNNRGQIQLYHVRDGQPLCTIRQLTNSKVLCGEFTPDGKSLVVGTLNGKVHQFDLASRALVRTIVGHLDGVGSLAFSPDGRTLATGGWDMTVRLWNVSSGREVARLEGHRGRIHALAFSPVGSVLASGGEIEGGMGEVLLWRGKADQTKTAPDAHNN